MRLLTLYNPEDVYSMAIIFVYSTKNTRRILPGQYYHIIYAVSLKITVPYSQCLHLISIYVQYVTFDKIIKIERGIMVVGNTVLGPTKCLFSDMYAGRIGFG